MKLSFFFLLVKVAVAPMPILRPKARRPPSTTGSTSTATAAFFLPTLSPTQWAIRFGRDSDRIRIQIPPRYSGTSYSKPQENCCAGRTAGGNNGSELKASTDFPVSSGGNIDDFIKSDIGLDKAAGIEGINRFSITGPEPVDLFQVSRPSLSKGHLVPSLHPPSSEDHE